MQPVSALSANPMSKHLMSIPRRERSSSTSDVSSRSQQHLLPPSPLVDSTRQSLDIQRSLSMPRGIRGLSAEPNPTKSLPSSKSTEFRAAISHRMIRRAETVETSHFSKEDFEVVKVTNSTAKLTTIPIEGNPLSCGSLFHILDPVTANMAWVGFASSNESKSIFSCKCWKWLGICTGDSGDHVCMFVCVNTRRESCLSLLLGLYHGEPVQGAGHYWTCKWGV